MTIILTLLSVYTLLSVFGVFKLFRAAGIPALPSAIMSAFLLPTIALRKPIDREEYANMLNEANKRQQEDMNNDTTKEPKDAE